MENTNRKEFDYAVGGTENLPNQINAMKFAQCRAKELKTMINALTQTSGTKLIFQQLPIHMRRRTMSHNVKRLPRRLREAHLHQLRKSGMPKKIKRPSRKFRRKPTNLLQEYNRRKRKHAWLETHIWHAKRFHMVERWGYKLPLQPCDKSFRALYRASAKHCLLQDISYYNCIEMAGNQDILVDGFRSMNSTFTGLTVGAKAYISGQREGTVMFYNKNSYPFKAIGEVKFTWKPSANMERIIWLWAHPAFYSELIECLKNVFSLEKLESTDAFSNSYSNISNGTTLTELKDKFNRFRLTGPLSNTIVQNALKTPLTNNQSTWFNSYLSSKDNKQIFHDQCSYWKMLSQLNTTEELSPHIVLNLIITDPRYNFPNKRTKATQDTSTADNIPEVTSSAKYGEIWNGNIRKNVADNQQSTAQFLKDRSNLIVPEESAPAKSLTIPLMLIQQPGVRDSSGRLGYCSGWDVIAPSSCGLPLWLCLVMWGGRPGGVRESESLRFEMGRPDILSPDTASGETDENNVSQKYQDKFFRLPPAKRINYNKLGIGSPFAFTWKKIIEEWSSPNETVEDFYVLRDRKKLNCLQQFLSTKNVRMEKFLKDMDIKFSDKCIVPVRLDAVSRGRARKYSVICLPEASDLIKKGKRLIPPIEPVHSDENQCTRKIIRDEHKKLLKILKKRRVRAKSKQKVLPPNDKLIEEQANKMRSLWLPEPKSIKNSCSRKVIGFVTNGDFSFISGQGRAVGFVALSALVPLFQSCQKNKVLVRDTSSRQYRFANLDIICP